MKDYRHRANQIGRRNFKDEMDFVPTSSHHHTAVASQYRDVVFKEDRKILAPVAIDGLARIDVVLNLPSNESKILSPPSSQNLLKSLYEESITSTSRIRSPHIKKKKSKSNIHQLSQEDMGPEVSLGGPLLAPLGEHADLVKRLQSTEEEERMSSSFHRSMLTPLEEHDLIARRLKDSEANAQAIASRNAIELSRIEARYNSLADQQTELIATLRENEEEIRRQSGAVTEKLLREKASLRERVDEMEREKNEVRARLIASEEQAKLEARAIEDKLTREKRLLEESVASMAREKEEMQQKMTAMAEMLSEQEKELIERVRAEEERLRVVAMQAMAQETENVLREKMEMERRLAAMEADVAAAVAREEESRTELQARAREDAIQAESLEAGRLEKERLVGALEAKAAAAMAQMEEDARVREEELKKLREDAARAASDRENVERELEIERAQLAGLLGVVENMRHENSQLKEEVIVSTAKHKQSVEEQQLEFEHNVKRMNDDKASLEALVKSIADTTSATSERHVQSSAELQMKLEAMERERAMLAFSLGKLEEQTKEQGRRMQEDMLREKEDMLLKMREAEEERKRCAADREAQEKAALDKVEAIAMELKLAKARKDEEERYRYEQEEKLKAQAVAAEELSRALCEQRELVARERAELARQAEENDRKAKSAQESVQAIILKERADLMRLVAKMKAEFEEEQKRKLADTHLKSTHDRSSGSLIGSRLNTKRSLFDLIEDQAAEEAEAEEMAKLMGPIIEKDERTGSKDSIDADYIPISRNSGDAIAKTAYTLNDLGAPHALAAAGNNPLLKEMEKLEPYLLCSLDEASRCPLFYAAANDRLETVQYLCELWPEATFYKDIHGDTAVHAAASAGTAKCLEILLMYNKSQPENNLGMSPVHMAHNVDCLQILYGEGYDFKSLDCSGRTPLFVACALNRIHCAQFILDCLESPEICLAMQDSRGDTPLHAASCNGSVDCLLLLLQFGMDPSRKNNKGLSAVDLAMKKKQTKCAKLLSEYTLHYMTSSEFDSIFFIAALKGNKVLQSLKQSRDDYSIIQKSADCSKTLQYSLQNNRPASFFSLKSNKSIRLQKWGSWIEYEDGNTNKIFWYNQRSQDARWDKPTEVEALQKKQQTNEVNSSKSCMRLRKNGDWVEYNTEFGHIFYYNEMNGKFQWTDPHGDDNDYSTQESTPWRPYKDPDTGELFWYNHETNASQWDCPFEDTRRARDDEAAVLVNDFSDLGI